MADEKQKILYLMQLLLEETDESHPLNAAAIEKRMQDRYQYKTYNRKTIYADVERLRDFGLKVEQSKGSSFGYYIRQRDFDLPELKLLVDAVQSSKFITKKKTKELIDKLGKLTSKENAKQLQRQVFIYNRIKAGNETIYANVDVIHEALYKNRQICFKYCEWTIKKELVRKKNGADYIVSPWALTWNDENYYLVAYDETAGIIKHYRVDKMQEIRITNEMRIGKEFFEDFDLAAFAKKTFGMYGGTDRRITLECKNYLIGVMMDRFGTDAMVIPHGADHFHISVTVAVSSQFFGWLAGLGKDVRIFKPDDVREQYTEYLKGIIDG